MQRWQHWITLGNQAFSMHQQQLAQQYYQQALADVWPVWYHCAFVECPAGLDTDEVALPTHCLAVTLLNLAESFASQQRWRRCRRTLQQGLYWFEQMLEECHQAHPATAAVLMHLSQLQLVSQIMAQRQLLALSEKQPATQGESTETRRFELTKQPNRSDVPRKRIDYLH